MDRVCKGCGAAGFEHYPTIKTWCKSCWRAHVKTHRASKPGHYRAYDKTRNVLPHRKKMKAAFQVGYRRQFPDRTKARAMVNRAVRKGQMVSLPCLICGDKAEAHHPDYTMPLDVVWLCSPHHKQAHALVRKAA